MKKFLITAGLMLAAPMIHADNFTEEQQDIFDRIIGIDFDDFNLNSLNNTGLGLDEQLLQKQGELRSLILFSNGFPISSTPTPTEMIGLFPGISYHDAKLLADVLTDMQINQGLTNQRKIDAILFSFILEFSPQLFAKAITDPGSPNSFSNVTIKNSLKNAIGKLTLQRPAKAGDWFSDMYASFDLSYSDYEDTKANNAGHIHYQSVTFGAMLAENTDLSFTLTHDEGDQSGARDLFSRTWGAQFSLHHSLNENFGIGTFGFISQSEYKTIADEVDTYGVGILATASWDFEFCRLSMAHSLTSVWTDFDQANIYMGMGKVSRDWNDWFTTGVYAYYNDSLRKAENGDDNSYWTLGADATFLLSDNLSLTFSIDSVEALNDYHQKTYFASLNWDF